MGKRNQRLEFFRRRMAKSKTGSRNEKKRQKSREIKKKGKSGSVTTTRKIPRGDIYDEKYIMYYIVYDITECMQFQK